MADIGRKAALAQSRAQLPVNAYFDESIYQLEQQYIFGQAARYIGQQKYVPELGDYRTLVQENNGRALIHNDQGIELISNVCRHRQAVMLGDIHQPNISHYGNLNHANPKTGEHTGGNIVCPLHRWTYNNQGTLIGAPDFPESPCLHLNRYPLQNWQGSLFEGSRNIEQDLGFLTQRPEFDLSGYMLDKIELHECNYNWKTFIEVYLEDYHVAPFHPGLGQFVTCNDLEWEFKNWLSVQTVGVHQALKNPGSSIYQAWHDALLNYRQGETPDFGAVWLAYYPTHMIELYPHTLVLSTLYPQGPQKTLNVVEFYYPEDIIHFEREFIEAQQAAYMETAVEDDEIAERMDAGRLALLKRGDNEVGPYQSPMEDGMQHFHEWYRSLIST